MADPISVMFSLTALMPPTCDPGNLDWGNSIAGRLVVMEEYVINIEHLVGPTVHCENKADGLNACVCSREVQESYFNLLLHYLWFFRLALAVRKRTSVTRRVSTFWRSLHHNYDGAEKSRPFVSVVLTVNQSRGTVSGAADPTSVTFDIYSCRYFILFIYFDLTSNGGPAPDKYLFSGLSRVSLRARGVIN